MTSKFRTVLGSRRFQDRSKYKPHQGDQECWRRIQQGYTSYVPMKPYRSHGKGE